MSLGETLRRARETRRVSLNQAALETRIRQSVLEALEDDDLHALPPRPFLRGLLRNYALYLHLDADSILEEYDVRTGHKSIAPPLTSPEPQPQNAPSASSVAAAPYSTTPEESTDAFAFPPFPLPGAKPNGETEPTATPPLETIFQVAPEIQEEVPPPTPPLNLSQEPLTLGQRIGGTRIPELVAILALAVTLFALVSVGFTTFQNFAIPLLNPPTPPPTAIATATIPHGSTPTGIPLIAQTEIPTTRVAAVAPPSATIALAIPTEIISPTETITFTTPTVEFINGAEMILEIQATDEMGARIIVDEDEVFNGTLKNETRTFIARSRIFMLIKNIGNGRVFFQGTRILPRNQEERSELYRAWLMNPLGTPVIVPPTPYPSPIAPTDFPTQTPLPSNTFTRTPTATATFTATATQTATTTQTATPTQTATNSATPSPTTMPTLEQSPSVTPSQ